MSKVSFEGIITEDDKRPHWENKTQYLLSCIGFAVGFGNLWRFPYLCHIYGGGAFLIPYAIALVFEGIPIFHLELAIGQFLRKGSIGVWSHISPYLGGIGYACMMISFIVGKYYNMIIAWVLWYLGNSFKEPLPWSICLNEASKWVDLIKECDHSSESNYFWYRYTLNISMDITQTGPVLWWLVVSLASSWIIVYLCTVQGIESTGKAIYISISFLYVTLTAFPIYALTLPGAIQGLFYLFIPDFTVLKNPRTWLDAATQSFSSLSLVFGGHIAYSSYNPQKNDCEKDSVIIATVDCLTSIYIIYTSITIFSILGFKATINYGDCLDRSSLGIICFASFLLGLLFTTRSGSYWIEVFDNYGGSIPLLIISLFELYGVVYVYGLKRFCDNMEWMTGRPVHFYWKASWQFISPLLMLSILLSYLAVQRPSTYTAWNPSYEGFPLKESKFYPRSVLFIGASLVVLPCIFIPTGAIYHFKEVLLKRKKKQVLHQCESTEGN
ncbi:LOW QUALITY PROTEIN: sodium-dependent neutral amino acid transporter B(0)AT3-like [Pseudonaja textilis]|uniref:LOW QUALITY PROTEIN: sodium-dependent neutral amino acid transporter B(0)AT3-like n=1 Tax=Pseudonaja textilis TaxID=8673 RepID=UPI000EAA601B|nr:LOW QUALITY PROTEIN: sodium-dependent neutral amino acid transporter B(0)AT3-like [Pseudonaja textilis]